MELPRGISIVSDPNYKPAKIVCPVVTKFEERKAEQRLPKYDPTVKLEELKEHWISQAIQYANGNVAKASVLLGLAKETLYKRTARLREKK